MLCDGRMVGGGGRWQTLPCDQWTVQFLLLVLCYTNIVTMYREWSSTGFGIKPLLPQNHLSLTAVDCAGRVNMPVYTNYKYIHGFRCRNSCQLHTSLFASVRNFCQFLQFLRIAQLSLWTEKNPSDTYNIIQQIWEMSG